MYHLHPMNFPGAGKSALATVWKTVLFTLLGLIASVPADAYDGQVRNQLRAGGLWIASSSDLAFRSTTIDLTPTRIAVRYVIENIGKHEVASTLYFQVPPIGSEHADNRDAFVWTEDGNPTDLRVRVDGNETSFTTSQHALHKGIDITETLKTSNLPLVPFGDALDEAVKALSKEAITGLRERGIFGRWKAGWQLTTTHYWRQNFSSHQPVTIEISYKPVMEELVDSLMVIDGKLGLGIDNESLDFLCLTKEQLNEINERFAKLDPTKFAQPYMIRALDYDLINITDVFTGINGLSFSIHTRNPDVIVSICGGRFQQTGPQEVKWQDQISHDTGRLKIHFLELDTADTNGAAEKN